MKRVATTPDCARYISSSTDWVAASIAASIAGKNRSPLSSRRNEFPVRHGQPVVVNGSGSRCATGTPLGHALMRVLHGDENPGRQVAA